MNAVEFKHVTKNRKHFSIEDLSMTIPQGYITGFIGPNGSGKTTTIQLMMDILQLDDGDIQLFGTSHKNHSTKQHVGFVYDDLYMYEEFTIKKMKAFIAPLYDTWNEKLFQRYIAQFNLSPQKKIKHFSKGMKMKCSLLFALAHEPLFIVMDEPTSGLDPIFRRELLDLLQQLMVREKQTIFLSTHITTDLDRIADYIIFIDHGQIVLQKSMEEIREKFHIVKGKKALLDNDIRNLFHGYKETAFGFEALFEGDPQLFEPFNEEVLIEPATLEDLMYFMTKEKQLEG
ncbi:ATP-binding cassette domain-containing protein [Virgibacillus sp. W0181]|uniref:ABC transporter ATP-binding protein n=1 Tax=Virgibacillus sp. W0181 TaxID=3391581 RepID=UPI003F449551